MQTATKDLSNATRPVEYLRPKASLATSKEGHTLRIEMPGVSSQGLEVSVEENELTVVGKRQPNTIPGEAIYTETRQWDYRRVFEFDPSLDASRIQARMEQGVLTLILPKAENRKPRKIVVE